MSVPGGNYGELDIRFESKAQDNINPAAVSIGRAVSLLTELKIHFLGGFLNGFTKDRLRAD